MSQKSSFASEAITWEAMAVAKEKAFKNSEHKMAEIKSLSKQQNHSTVIKGYTRWQTCWRHACYLSQYIYSDPPPVGGFKTRFPEKMQEVEEHWEQWDEIVDQEESGFVARLFKVKSEHINHDSPHKNCPPTLVFRGSDMEDMRNIAISASFKVWRFTVFKEVFCLEDLVTPHKAIGREETTYEELMSDDKTEAIQLFTGQPEDNSNSGWFSLPFSGDITLFVKEDGDWANNLRQALGLESQQYKMAIRYTSDVLKQYILPSGENRLELTGHSLGGGLASAACAWLDRVINEEKLKASVHAITFNPAGVHKNTVAPASLLSGHIHAFAVQDEILTTLQSHKNVLPFVADILRLAGPFVGSETVPPAMGHLISKPGISPGRLGEEWSVPAKGELLPTLFGLDEQEIISQEEHLGFPETKQIQQLLHESDDVLDFLTKVLEYLTLRYLPRYAPLFAFAKGYLSLRLSLILFTNRLGVVLAAIDVYKEYLKKILPREMRQVLKLIQASVDYHGMDYVIASYEHHFGKKS